MSTTHPRGEAATSPHPVNPATPATPASPAVPASAGIDWLAADLGQRGPVNVAQVRHLSPFRYPGGKTWLVPGAMRWLDSLPRQSVLLEPFAGGAMIGLSAAATRAVDRVELVELDDDVAAVWECVFNGTDRQFAQFCNGILTFEVTLDNVIAVLDPTRSSLPLQQRAFRTIVKNRVQRGGIMAPGAGLTKSGENGKGLVSRWYPETLVKRLSVLRQMREVVGFTQGDALTAIETHAGACLFVDPPYTAGGKRAGSRLYTHNELDHEGLFDLVAANPGPALLTYDDSEEVRAMATQRGLTVGDVSMKSAHHAVMRELAIFKAPTASSTD